MSQFQIRQSIASLCQSVYIVVQGLNPSDTDIDTVQGHLDAIITWSNTQTASATPDNVSSVDVGGVKRRKDAREKKNKDNKDKDTAPTT